MRVTPLTIVAAAMLFAAANGPVLADTATKKPAAQVQTNNGPAAATEKTTKLIIVITDGNPGDDAGKSKSRPTLE